MNFGEDEKHFNRPTFINWLPDGTMFVTDGYGNTRVVKFDRDGKYLMAWGQPSTPPDDVRPGTFHDVHGVVFDLPRHRVFVTDRSDHRIQIFDENGKFLDQWTTGKPSTPQFLYKAADVSRDEIVASFRKSRKPDARTQAVGNSLRRVIPIIVAQQIVQEQGARSVNVPIEAHILAVAEAYQKLISGANGKAPLSPQQAEQEKTHPDPRAQREPALRPRPGQPA